MSNSRDLQKKGRGICLDREFHRTVALVLGTMLALSATSIALTLSAYRRLTKNSSLSLALNVAKIELAIVAD